MSLTVEIQAIVRPITVIRHLRRARLAAWRDSIGTPYWFMLCNGVTEGRSPANRKRLVAPDQSEVS